MDRARARPGGRERRPEGRLFCIRRIWLARATLVLGLALAPPLAAVAAAQRKRSRWLNVNSFVAYLMFMNDVVKEDFTLSKENFASVKLPNAGRTASPSRSQKHGSRRLSSARPLIRTAGWR